MAKPAADPNTSFRATQKSTGNWDPRLASTEQGVESGCAELSFLKGAIGSGERDSPFDGPYSAKRYSQIMELREKTVEQGSSTFCKDDFEPGDDY